MKKNNIYEAQWYKLCRMEFRCDENILMNRNNTGVSFFFCGTYFVNGMCSYQDNLLIPYCNVHILKLSNTFFRTLRVLPIEFINLLSYFLTINIH